MTETKLTNLLCRQLREKYGAVSIPIAGGRYGLNGAPDRAICVNGRVTLIEFKGYATEIRKVQYVLNERIRSKSRSVVFARFRRGPKTLPLRVWLPGTDEEQAVTVSSLDDFYARAGLPDFGLAPTSDLDDAVVSQLAEADKLAAAQIAEVLEACFEQCRRFPHVPVAERYADVVRVLAPSGLNGLRQGLEAATAAMQAAFSDG